LVSGKAKNLAVRTNFTSATLVSFNHFIDETGEKKKGNKTDYVKRQYIGNLGKTENGIVVVTAYGVFSGMTFPLLFEVISPKKDSNQESSTIPNQK